MLNNNPFPVVLINAGVIFADWFTPNWTEPIGKHHTGPFWICAVALFPLCICDDVVSFVHRDRV